MTREQQPDRLKASDRSVLRSRDLAELAGTTPRALRHYHSIGLLPEVPRDSNGYRRYSPRDLVRVLRIRQLAASGLPLRRIGAVLEQDARNRDAVLDELEDELKTQAERIEAQRTMLADLRRSRLDTAQFSDAASPTETQRLDQEVWTVVTATGEFDTTTSAAVVDAIHGAAVAEDVSTWYPEFERLEEHESVDTATAARLAQQMADFAVAVMDAVGSSPVDEERSIVPLIDQMLADGLSPAQQDVWSRFASIIEERGESAQGISD